MNRRRFIAGVPVLLIATPGSMTGGQIQDAGGVVLAKAEKADGENDVVCGYLGFGRDDLASCRERGIDLEQWARERCSNLERSLIAYLKDEGFITNGSDQSTGR